MADTDPERAGRGVHAAAELAAARIRSDEAEAMRIVNAIPEDEIRYTAIYLAGMVAELIIGIAGSPEKAEQLIPGLLESAGEDGINATTLLILKNAEDDLD